MKEMNVNRVIWRFEQEERNRINRELQARLKKSRTREELLSRLRELAAEEIEKQFV